MKNLISIFLLFIGGVLTEVNAQGIRFYEGSFESALEQAKKENKPVFVDFYTEWCGPCKCMSQNIFTRSDVGDYFNAHIISCKIDAEKEGKNLARKYEIHHYPTMLFLNGNGEIISKIIGKQEAVDLIRSAKLVVSGNMDYSYADLEKNYESKKNDPVFLKIYLEQMNKTGKIMYEAFDNYLRVQSEMKENQVEMMEFLMGNQKHLILGGKTEEVFVNNYSEYMDIATRREEGALRAMMYKIYANTRSYALQTKNVELFKRAMEFIPHVPEEYAFVSYNDMRLDLYLLEGKEKLYRKEATHYLDSIVSSRSIEEIQKTDDEFYKKRCREIDSTGEGGMYKELYKEAYRSMGANIQINAIIKEGNRLLKDASKKDYKNIWRWIDYGKRLAPDNYDIRNFAATVLYYQGEKDEAIRQKEAIINAPDLKSAKLKYVIEEELKKIKNGTY